MTARAKFWPLGKTLTYNTVVFCYSNDEISEDEFAMTILQMMNLFGDIFERG